MAFSVFFTTVVIFVSSVAFASGGALISRSSGPGPATEDQYMVEVDQVGCVLKNKDLCGGMIEADRALQLNKEGQAFKWPKQPPPVAVQPPPPVAIPAPAPKKSFWNMPPPKTYEPNPLRCTSSGSGWGRSYDCYYDSCEGKECGNSDRP